MYLHDNKLLFADVIEETNIRTGIAHSIIFESLHDDMPELETQYGLTPFRMQVQSVSRTFIDKIYALCDYYMGKKAKRFSRHLYDIYKLYPVVTFDDTFKELICQVREHRSHLSICPSAQPNVNIKALIYEFLDNEFYKHD